MPFEDELGEALRRAGDGFTADRHALADAGEQRGRRLVARRRAAVVGGSVLALAVIGTVGVHAGGLLDGAGGSGEVNVAAPPPLPTGGDDPKKPRTGTGAVSADQLIAVYKELLPRGKVSEAEARGTGDRPGPMVHGVYDDGKGKAAIGVGLSRTDPDGTNARQMLQCPDENLQQFDGCTVETLTDGSKLLVYQGYEYPDRREPTKLWRATLVTREGFQVDVQEWNAPAEKGAQVSRPQPPLTPAQLKAFAVSPLWHPALNDLPAAEPEAPVPPSSGPAGAAAVDTLEGLLRPYGIPVAAKGGEGPRGYVVLDDGKGKSLVELEIQTRAGGGDGAVAAYLTADPATVTLPDGTKMLAGQRPGEKGGAGVVWWSVDTLRPNGVRVIVSAFNAKNQQSAAARTAPALTMEQLKAIATHGMWKDYQ
ncbi:hypothetical protein ABZX75_11975 [Streptomyces sp. NPDC003038]|uniref:hypothetical protein n=1 Tax=unclassified Streptomyces TaxID=2593676 RepID=UPI0033BD9F23